MYGARTSHAPCTSLMHHHSCTITNVCMTSILTCVYSLSLPVQEGTRKARGAAQGHAEAGAGVPAKGQASSSQQQARHKPAGTSQAPAGRGRAGKRKLTAREGDEEVQQQQQKKRQQQKGQQEKQQQQEQQQQKRQLEKRVSRFVETEAEVEGEVEEDEEEEEENVSGLIATQDEEEGDEARHQYRLADCEPSGTAEASESGKDEGEEKGNHPGRLYNKYLDTMATPQGDTFFVTKSE